MQTPMKICELHMTDEKNKYLHMKTLIKYLFISIAFMACNNDDKPADPISQLPRATKVGANKIGCLVNGVPFTDSGLMNNFYQLVDGEYYLSMSWEQGGTGNFKSGNINLRRVDVVEGETYILNINSIQNDFTGGSANYTYSNSANSGEYETNPTAFGTVTFTKFDKQNQIMSGTFEFQAQEITTGEIINISDGRFDLTFTNKAK